MFAATIVRRMARPAHVTLAALAAALVAAAVWLLVQTRPHTTVPEPVAVAPAVDAMVERRPPSPLRPPTPPPADAAIAVVAVDASPPEPDASDPHAERVALTAHMAARPGRERWARKGEALLDEVALRAQRVDERGCYISGCTATFWFASRDAYDAVVRDEATSPVYAAWTGGKSWTTPEPQPDGQVVVALLLYRPD
jgi:hypothetical protein